MQGMKELSVVPSPYLLPVQSDFLRRKAKITEEIFFCTLDPAGWQRKKDLICHEILEVLPHGKKTRNKREPCGRNDRIRHPCIAGLCHGGCFTGEVTLVNTVQGVKASADFCPSPYLLPVQSDFLRRKIIFLDFFSLLKHQGISDRTHVL